MADGIKVQLADAVVGVVTVFDDLPIAVVGVVAITEAGIAADPVLEQERAHLHGGIDLKAVSCEIRLAAQRAADRDRGQILPEDVALDRVPDPDHLGGVGAIVKETH